MQMMSNRIASFRRRKLTIDTRPRKFITTPPACHMFPSVPSVQSVPSVPSVLGRAVTRASPSARANCPSSRASQRARASCPSALASPSARVNPMELYQTTARAAQALGQLLGLRKHSGNCLGCQVLGLPKRSGNCSGCSSTWARQKTARAKQEKLPKKKFARALGQSS